MSRRERRKKKIDIPWLEQRSGYPSPEERAALIDMRIELDVELLLLIAQDISPDSPQGRKLWETYGEAEVQAALTRLEEFRDMLPYLAEEAHTYRGYRQRYAGFGGSRPFLSAEEYSRRHTEYMHSVDKNFDPGKGLIDIKGDPALYDLLLMGWSLWRDLTPPDVPPRPAGFSAPRPGSYSGPAADLLTWGPELSPERLNLAAEDPLRWQKHIPALERMALDPGLLDGWPGEAASWAPWHALHLLGALGAWESAASLLALQGRPNDWLSDRLPKVWADMGLQVEPILSMLLSDPAIFPKRRCLAAAGLQELAEEEPVLNGKLVRDFSQILQTPEPFDSGLNATLIFILDSMDLSPEARPAIEAAFAAGRVDTDFIRLEDMEWRESQPED